MSIDDLLFGSIDSNPAPIARPSSDIQLPPSWIEVIDAIRRYPGWACSTIAGGALRDLDNGRQVKDVDIFVPYRGDNEEVFKALSTVLPSANITEIEHNVHNASQLGAEGISHFLFEVDGWKFEISQKTEIFNHVNLLGSFDIGICMISLSLSNNIYRSSYYNLDKARKQLRVVQATGGREMEHAERLARKYTDWTIVPL